MQANLEELFFAEELPEVVGGLDKNPVIFDEDAPLKACNQTMSEKALNPGNYNSLLYLLSYQDKVTRIPDGKLDAELAKRGVTSTKGSRVFREKKLLELLKAEEEEVLASAVSFLFIVIVFLPARLYFSTYPLNLLWVLDRPATEKR